MDDIKKLERELGISKKRIETLEKELDIEKAKGEAYSQLETVNTALITAIVRRLGEAKINQKDINEALDNKLYVTVSYDAETCDYILRTSENE